MMIKTKQFIISALGNILIPRCKSCHKKIFDGEGCPWTVCPEEFYKPLPKLLSAPKESKGTN